MKSELLKTLKFFLKSSLFVTLTVVGFTLLMIIFARHPEARSVKKPRQPTLNDASMVPWPVRKSIPKGFSVCDEDCLNRNPVYRSILKMYLETMGSDYILIINDKLPAPGRKRTNLPVSREV